MRHARRKGAIILGVIVGLAIIIGFIAIRAHAPVREGSAPGRAPALWPAVPSTDGLPAAPDVEIVMYQGEAAVGDRTIRLSRLWAKRKPVVLNYFAGLCPPCRRELPDFQRLYTGSAKDKFTLIGIDIGSFVGLGSPDDARALLRELKITFPAGTLASADGFLRYGILGMPTTVFITGSGKILKTYTGILSRDQMNTFIGELLKVSGAGDEPRRDDDPRRGRRP
jgi:thiol-disulfide isomerase/thioredoxin